MLANCARKSARPFRTSAASSGLWSATKRKGVDAAYSGHEEHRRAGTEQRHAVIARQRPGLVSCQIRSPRAELAT